jgi:hypothetical protein
MEKENEKAGKRERRRVDFMGIIFTTEAQRHGGGAG